VWEMTAAGQMPRGEVANFIPKNIITRSLGPHSEVQVDLEGPFPLEVGDTFLLCSDGLSGQLKDAEIGAVLTALSPQEAVGVLIATTTLRGAPDNTPATAVRVWSFPAADKVDASPVALEPAAAGHPALWGLTAAGLLVGLGLALTGHYIAALVSVLIGAIGAVAALVANMSGSGPRNPVKLDGPLGSGPHGAHDCTPNAESVAVASQMAQQLREATRTEHWTLDWGKFNALGEQAQSALAAGDFTGAVRNYALAISFMMSEIRRQAARKDHRDSSVLDM